MRENYEFQLYTRYALEVCDRAIVPKGRKSPGVTVRGVVGDEQYRRVERLERELRRVGTEFALAGWEITREYSATEIERAELFLVKLRFAHAAGNEFGTEYSESPPNPSCGLGREQVRVVMSPFRVIREQNLDLHCALGSHQIGPLKLPANKMLKNHDMFMLWSGETIVSSQMATALEGMTGAELLPISQGADRRRSRSALLSVSSGSELIARAEELHVDSASEYFWTWVKERDQSSTYGNAMWELAHDRVSKGFYQLTVQSRRLKVDGRTAFGDSPFQENPSEHCRCEFGEIVGARLLSVLSVARSSWDGSDVCETDIFVGTRMGLFRPYRLLIVSQKLFRRIQQLKLKGLRFEVVELY